VGKVDILMKKRGARSLKKVEKSEVVHMNWRMNIRANGGNKRGGHRGTMGERCDKEGGR